MSKYLVRTVETYRVDNEGEAKRLIEEAKADKNYSLNKYSSEYRCTKTKGEISDDWYRVILTKDFTSEKEPDATVSVKYESFLGAFPSPVETTDNEGVEF